MFTCVQRRRHRATSQGLLLVLVFFVAPIARAEGEGACASYDAQRDPEIRNYQTPGFEEWDGNTDDWPVFVEDRPFLDRPFDVFDLYFSDVAFVGRIVDYEKRCLNSRTSFPESIVVIRFRVESSFWGVRYPEIVVEAKTNQGQDCIYYEPPPYSEFAIGDRYLVLACIEGTRMCARDYLGLLRVTDSAFVSSHGWNLPLRGTEALLLAASECRSYEAQAQESDLVCEVVLADNGRDIESRTMTVVVEKVHKGQLENRRIGIRAVDNRNTTSPCDYSIISTSAVREGSRCLVFLEKDETGLYRTLHGWHSVLELKGECVFTRRDDYVMDYADLLSLVYGALRN